MVQGDHDFKLEATGDAACRRARGCALPSNRARGDPAVCAAPLARCRLVHTEEFSGCLGGLFGRMFETNSTKGFVLMNEALKARAEQAK